jgi:hypothetical protein
MGYSMEQIEAVKPGEQSLLGQSIEQMLVKHLDSDESAQIKERIQIILEA